LNTTVDSEACPNNLAPTNSTTAQLVMGDALAVFNGNARFQTRRFCCLPSWWRIRQKLLRVKDILEHTLKPMVSPDASIKGYFRNI
jgi:arabinose-5-phosphate isomerase